MRDTYAIRTPENVAFEFELAGIAARAVALLVDYVVMGAMMLVAIVAALALGVVAGGVAAAFYFVAAFVVQWGYGALCEWRFDGQTLGKRIVGIRVMRAEGRASRSRRRSSAISFASSTSCRRSIWSPESAYRSTRADGDSVISRRERSSCDSGDRRGPRASSPRRSATTRSSRIPTWCMPPAASRRSSVRSWSRSRLRREQLPLAVRYALFAKLAQHFEQRLHLPRPRHFSAERYVLNLAATSIARQRDPRPTPPDPQEPHGRTN